MEGERKIGMRRGPDTEDCGSRKGRVEDVEMEEFENVEWKCSLARRSQLQKKRTCAIICVMFVFVD
jgi:hypothetical protein